ncbi:putative aliphatic sulfonates transport permease protein SsuC [Antarctobacter heliothermus]|uniref:Putative aliphatic sulfonates transport permease protein SsuC n=1 Tax=Antarctobacter heliothermus TaxID=74033 RepID=A0A222E0H1_9RHOB|nr:ABC transporter permease [Antarctobacter heliothermus]ASP19471.1 putative aliphatic sulfonates transport permease protein SsuC [Antarctobacter heliothermus]
MKDMHAATPILSIIGLLLLWILCATLTADPTVLPQPWSLIPPAAREIGSGELPFHLGATLLRVIWAFALAMTIGIALGLAMGRSEALNRWLDPWLVIFLNLPALVLIVLCYLWIGLNETAAILAVTLNKIPNVATVIREGARALDPDLDAIARVYRMSWLARMRHVTLPQLAPFITAAARSGVAVIWKIVLVVEFLGRSNGVGFQIHLYFQLFDVAMVLVYALSFIAVMLAVEWLVLQPWERRIRRWRTV